MHHNWNQDTGKLWRDWQWFLLHRQLRNATPSTVQSLKGEFLCVVEVADDENDRYRNYSKEIGTNSVVEEVVYVLRKNYEHVVFVVFGTPIITNYKHSIRKSVKKKAKKVSWKSVLFSGKETSAHWISVITKEKARKVSKTWIEEEKGDETRSLNCIDLNDQCAENKKGVKRNNNEAMM